MNRRTRPKPPALLAVVCLLLAGAAAAARAQESPRAYSESPLPRPTGYVNDHANVIDAATKQRLESLLTELKTAGNIEFAVVTVPTTGDTPIFDYTLSVARGWGIGAKESQSKGAILVVAVNDRKYFMQVSRHLEGDLPDGLIGEILRQKLPPRFRSGDYAGGIADAVQTFAATLAQKQGFTLSGAGQEQAYRPPVRQTREPRTNVTRRGGRWSIGTVCCLVVVVIFVLLIAAGRGGGRGGRGGRGGWGGGGGLLNALLLANVLSSLGGSSRGSSSGWGGFGGGGSSGWGGGGGGGGFGGFGGGGDFGGGGAGGDW
jgi:uncharacterized protein